MAVLSLLSAFHAFRLSALNCSQLFTSPGFSASNVQRGRKGNFIRASDRNVYGGTSDPSDEGRGTVAGDRNCIPALATEELGRGGESRRRIGASGVNSEGVISASMDNEGLDYDSNNISSKCVLVVGATGGVGQLVVASLIEKGIPVRALLRNVEKARNLFGEQTIGKLQICVGDTRHPEQLDAPIFEGVTHVICCTGTTAFPSKRWLGGNNPEKTDYVGVQNLVSALPGTVQRFVLVSSVGVTKYSELPWNIMNLFGVLKFKKMGEDFLQNSGVPYTIIRAGRLTDGPYTSYDLNTLLKATAGTRRAVLVGQGDRLVGEASRIIIAEACVQSLDISCTCWETYEINSIEGDGPGKNKRTWEYMFKKAREVDMKCVVP